MLKPSSDVLTDRSKTVLSCGSVLFLCLTFVFVLCSLLITWRERADLLALLCVRFSCVVSLSHIWCLGSGVVLDCIDS